jgi:hypothetical protein
VVATAYLHEQTVVTLNAVKRGGDDLAGWGRGVMAMSGIPAKCLDCGQILAYGGGRSMVYCPNCEARKADAMKPEELKNAA